MGFIGGSYNLRKCDVCGHSYVPTSEFHICPQLLPATSKLRRPEEIMAELSTKRAELLEVTITKLAEQLEVNFRGEPEEVWLDGNIKNFEGIGNALESRFRDFGWDLKFSPKSFSNQKDGDRTCFIIQPLGEEP